LQRFADDYGDDVSDGTLGRAFRELGACLIRAVDDGYLERNPVRPFVTTSGAGPTTAAAQSPPRAPAPPVAEAHCRAGEPTRT
jgi:hypothetical protein